MPQIRSSSVSGWLLFTKRDLNPQPHDHDASALPLRYNPGPDLQLLTIFFQLTDALTFLHVSCRYIHRNVCPNSVYISKSGTWKLGGLEFMGKLA